MPRKSRIDAAGAIHHVFARGINRISEYNTAGLAWLLNIVQSAVSMEVARSRIQAEEQKLSFEILSTYILMNVPDYLNTVYAT